MFWALEMRLKDVEPLGTGVFWSLEMSGERRREATDWSVLVIGDAETADNFPWRFRVVCSTNLRAQE